MIAQLPASAMPIGSLRGSQRGKDVFVVGSGPSLQGFDWGLLAGRVTIALNAAAEWFRPSIWLFNDERAGLKSAPVVKPGADVLVVCQSAAPPKFLAMGWPHVYRFENADRAEKVTPFDDKLFCWSTVATAGIHLAYKLGAARVLLLGIDAYRDRRKEDGHPGAYYADGSRSGETDTAMTREVAREDDGRIVEKRHEDWRRDMRSLRAWFDATLPKAGAALGVWPERGIYTVGSRSRVDAWERVSMEEALGGRGG